jgi:hypothetical protein
MLLTEGFLEWLSRFKGMGGWVGGGMGGWPVCEAWVEVWFINLWLISDRHRYCTYLYY